MKSAIKRLEALEKNRPVHREPGPVFMWCGWEMTPKKEAMILRNYPNVSFWKVLSLTLPYGMKKQEGIIKPMYGGQMIWPDPDAQKKRDAKIRRTAMKPRR